MIVAIRAFIRRHVVAPDPHPMLSRLDVLDLPGGR